MDLYCDRRVYYWDSHFRHGSALHAWHYGYMPRFDRGMDFLVERWGWTWLEQPENAWRKKYPKITQKIDDMEMRLKNLETKSNTKIIRQKETKK